MYSAASALVSAEIMCRCACVSAVFEEEML